MQCASACPPALLSRPRLSARLLHVLCQVLECRLIFGRRCSARRCAVTRASGASLHRCGRAALARARGEAARRRRRRRRVPARRRRWRTAGVARGGRGGRAAPSGCRRGRERRAMRHACCVRVGASVKVRSKLGHQYTRLTHTHSLYPGTQKGAHRITAHSSQGASAHGPVAGDRRRGVRRRRGQAPSRSLHVPFRQSTCGLSAPHRGAAPTQTTICRQQQAATHTVRCRCSSTGMPLM